MTTIFEIISYIAVGVIILALLWMIVTGLYYNFDVNNVKSGGVEASLYFAGKALVVAAGGLFAAQVLLILTLIVKVLL